MRRAVGAEVDEPSIAGTLGLDGERRRVARECRGEARATTPQRRTVVSELGL